MRKYILLFLLLTSLLVNKCISQDKKFEIGALAAPSYIFMYGNDITKHNDHGYIGFSAGASFQYNATKVFSLHADILYERKGFAKTESYIDLHGNTIVFTNVSYHFDYLCIPVLARLSIREKKAEFFMNAGPFLGVYLQQTRNVPPPYLSDGQKMEPLDAGVSIGLGVCIPIKDKFAFYLEARDNTGLVNISTIPLPDKGAINTNSMNLFIGFVYKIGKKKEVKK